MGIEGDKGSQVYNSQKDEHVGAVEVAYIPTPPQGQQKEMTVKITYHDLARKLELRDPEAKVPIQVRLDGNVVGVIRHVKGGFAYYPKGAGNQKYHGDTYATLEQCKASLEPEPLVSA